MTETYDDPVCGMDVTPETAAATFALKRTPCYFCSPGCKRHFEQDSEKYLASGYQASM